MTSLTRAGRRGDTGSDSGEATRPFGIDSEFHSRTTGAALTGLAGLATAGKLTLRVADPYPLADAAKAHERLQAGGVRGRLVLLP